MASSISHGINYLNYITGEAEKKTRPDLIHRIHDNLIEPMLDPMGIWMSMELTELNTRLSLALTKVDELITEIRAASETNLSEQTTEKLSKITDGLTSVINEAIRSEGAKIVSNVKKQGENVVAYRATTGNSIVSAINVSANAATDKLSEYTDKTVTSIKAILGSMEADLSQHVDKEIHRMSKNDHRVSIPTWLFVILFIAFAILCALLTIIFYENSQHWHYEQLTLLYHTIVGYLTKAAIIISLISTVGTVFLYLAKKFPYG